MAIFTWGAALVLAATAASSEGAMDAAGHAKPSAQDRGFAAYMSASARFKSETGALAMKRGRLKLVRSIASQETHEAATLEAKLAKIASAQGIVLPDTLGSTLARKLRELVETSGERFDKAYLADMNDVHTEDGVMIAREQSSSTDVTLLRLAAPATATNVGFVAQIKLAQALMKPVPPHR